MYANWGFLRFFLGFILQNLYVFNIHKVEMSIKGVWGHAIKENTR